MKMPILATGTITLDNGQAVAAVIFGHYYYDPGVYTGPYENCYPAEEEYEVTAVSWGPPQSRSHTTNMEIFSDAEYKQLLQLLKTEAEKIHND